MKHNLKITLIILVMFLIAQFIGLVVIANYDNFFGKSARKAIQEGKLEQPNVSIVRETLPPPIEYKKKIDVIKVVITIIIAIVIATILFLVLSRMRTTIVIKVWFTIVVLICLVLTFSLLLYPIMPKGLFSLGGKSFSLAEIIAIPLAIVFTVFKIFKRNLIAHNISELFIYPGLAVIFISILNLLAVSILLVLISVYDMIAVWKTKSMIKMAKFQMEKLKIFSGFFLPYIKKQDIVKIKKARTMMLKQKNQKQKKIKTKVKERLKNIKINVAALGGGDVTFPLIFVGTVLFVFGLVGAIITIACATLALFLLLVFSKKGKFYPAMPFISAGCFFGLLISWLITLI